MAYYRLEPFGEERADYRQAITSQILANVHRGKEQRPFPIDEFLVVQPIRELQSADQMIGMLAGLCTR